MIFDNKMQASRTALKQSILYVATSFSTVAWITAPFISLELNLQNKRAGYFFAFMVNAVVPLQRLFTLIIFVRLDYLRRRQIVEADGHTKSRWQCSRECLFSPDMQSSNTRRRRSSIVDIMKAKNGPVRTRTGTRVLITFRYSVYVCRMTTAHRTDG